MACLLVLLPHLHGAEVFVLTKPSLSIILWTLPLVLYWKKSLPKLKVPSVPPRCFVGLFSFCFTFRAVICFELIFAKDVRSVSTFFFFFASRCPVVPVLPLFGQL